MDILLAKMSGVQHLSVWQKMFCCCDSVIFSLLHRVQVTKSFYFIKLHINSAFSIALVAWNNFHLVTLIVFEHAPWYVSSATLLFCMPDILQFMGSIFRFLFITEGIRSAWIPCKLVIPSRFISFYFKKNLIFWY